MVQVLVNLLDNAMKHTGENGWICIEARYDAGKVWISVEDDGDGIQEDLKENIFDEFVTTISSDGSLISNLLFSRSPMICDTAS